MHQPPLFSLLVLCVSFISLTSSCGSSTRPLAADESQTSRFIEVIASGPSDPSLDVLLVIDNSPSMKDKMLLLEKWLVPFAQTLVAAPCLDDSGHAVPLLEGACPSGTSRKHVFSDVHLGIITSSLGNPGEGACADGAPGHPDDRARLLPSIREGVPDPDGTGFLRYVRGTDPSRFVENLTRQLESIGADGCPHPAPLEAIYRFLIDPSPAREIRVDSSGNVVPARDFDGELLLDTTLLRQRETFLRPHSWVQLVVISDQDDWSIPVGQPGLEHSQLGVRLLDPTFEFPPEAPVCSSNPSDECCFSCLDDSRAPATCDRSFCNDPRPRSPSEDRFLVRSFEPLRRFGIDLRTPLARYIEGLSSRTVFDAWTRRTTENPLFRSSGRTRDPALIRLISVSGLPWQDVTDLVDAPRRIRLVSPSVTGFGLFLGESGEKPLPPADPFLRPSIEERPIGVEHPLTGDVISSSHAFDPQLNAINGHETKTGVVSNRYADGQPALDELQPSVIFPLDVPRDCSGDPSCPCFDEPSKNRAICQNRDDLGPASTIQTHAGATPSPRIWSLARQLPGDSLLAPLFPALVEGNPSSPSFGYNPIAHAILPSAMAQESILCIDTPLLVSRDHRVDCALLEARRAHKLGLSFTCQTLGRREVSESLSEYAIRELTQKKCCDTDDCSEYHLCEIPQLGGSDLDACQAGSSPSSAFSDPGFCYIDPQSMDEDGLFNAGGDAIRDAGVLRCWESHPRGIRMVGNEVPVTDSVLLLACQELTGGPE